MFYYHFPVDPYFFGPFFSMRKKVVSGEVYNVFFHSAVKADKNKKKTVVRLTVCLEASLYIKIIFS